METKRVKVWADSAYFTWNVGHSDLRSEKKSVFRSAFKEKVGCMESKASVAWYQRDPISLLTCLGVFVGLYLQFTRDTREIQKDQLAPNVRYFDIGISFQKQDGGPHQVEWMGVLTNHGSKGVDVLNVSIAKSHPMKKIEANYPFEIVEEDSQSITLRLKTLPPNARCILTFIGTYSTEVHKIPQISKAYSNNNLWEADTASFRGTTFALLRHLVSRNNLSKARVAGTLIGEHDLTQELLDSDSNFIIPPDWEF